MANAVVEKTQEENIPLTEEKEAPKTLSKEKVEALKKARNERTRKIKEFNEKELNLIHSLDNIYNTLTTMEIKLNHLDSTVKNTISGGLKRNMEDEEEPVSHKRIKTEEQMEVDNLSDEDSCSPLVTSSRLGDGLVIAGSFFVLRFAWNLYKLYASPVDNEDHTSKYDSAFA